MPRRKNEETDATAQETTQYSPTETRVLTPEQAAQEAVDRAPASAQENRQAADAMKPLLPAGVIERTIDGGYVTETVRNDKGELPIATSGDDYYTQAVKDTPTLADYNQDATVLSAGEVVEK